jgi:hypothetical protein
MRLRTSHSSRSPLCARSNTRPLRFTAHHRSLLTTSLLFTNTQIQLTTDVIRTFAIISALDHIHRPLPTTAPMIKTILLHPIQKPQYHQNTRNTPLLDG